MPAKHKTVLLQFWKEATVSLKCLKFLIITAVIERLPQVVEILNNIKVFIITGLYEGSATFVNLSYLCSIGSCHVYLTSSVQSWSKRNRSNPLHVHWTIVGDFTGDKTKATGTGMDRNVLKERENLQLVHKVAKFKNFWFSGLADGYVAILSI